MSRNSASRHRGEFGCTRWVASKAVNQMLVKRRKLPRWGETAVSDRYIMLSRRGAKTAVDNHAESVFSASRRHKKALAIAATPENSRMGKGSARKGRWGNAPSYRARVMARAAMKLRKTAVNRAMVSWKGGLMRPVSLVIVMDAIVSQDVGVGNGRLSHSHSHLIASH